MDRKIKKKLEVAQKKLQKLRQQLAGARAQDDEPGEVERLETEIGALEAEVKKLRGE